MLIFVSDKTFHGEGVDSDFRGEEFMTWNSGPANGLFFAQHSLSDPGQPFASLVLSFLFSLLKS